MQKVLLDSVTFALEKIIHSLLIFLRIDSDGLTENYFYSLHFIRQHVENCLIYTRSDQLMFSIVMLRGHCVQS